MVVSFGLFFWQARPTNIISIRENNLRGIVLLLCCFSHRLFQSPAAVPTDAAGATPAAQPLIQLTQVEWQAALARITALEQLQAQPTEAQSQLKAAEASFMEKLKEQTQSSIARENAVKDSCQS